MTNYITLVNNERTDQYVLSSKSCTPSTDYCVYVDDKVDTCGTLGGSVDICKEDFAGCSVGAIDDCYEDWAGCYGPGVTDYCQYEDH